MNAPLLLASLLCAVWNPVPQQSDPATKVLWQIGQADDDHGEFALAPDGFRQFLNRDFGWPDRSYVIGRSKPGADWPYVLPGPADGWAGSDGLAGTRTQTLTILFELGQQPVVGSHRLIIDLVDAQTVIPPRFLVLVNDVPHELEVAAGASEDSITGSAAAGREQLLVVALTANDLRNGVNEIALTSIQGSWILFDQVRMEAPAAASLAAPDPTRVRSVRAAQDQLDRGGARGQVVLVDLEHRGDERELAFSLAGESLATRLIEPGRTVLELTVPAVEEPTRSRFEVAAEGRVRWSGEIDRAPRPEVTPADYVDPFLGVAHSRWMIAPGPWAPFGMVKLSPENQNAGWQGGYDPSIDNVAGFSHIHEWTMAGLLMMPTTGPLRVTPGDQYRPDEGYRSRIDRRKESAGIGWYHTFLEDYGIDVELAATTRAGMQRYAFPPADQARVLIDLQFPAEYRFEVHRYKVGRVGKHRVEGFCTQHSPRVWSNGDQDYTVYFAVEFDAPMKSLGSWVDGRVSRDVHTTSGGKVGDVGVFVEFDARDGLVVHARSAISLVGLEQARLNLQREMVPLGWNVERVVAHQREAWNDILGRIEIDTDDRREKVRFYTNLYHCYCSRTIWSDVDGSWVDAFEKVQKLDDPDRPVLGCDAFWNTFWNLNQVWNLITPGWSSRWVSSQLEMYDTGGWLAKGPAGMEYVPVMVAEHEIPLMVAAWQHGIRDFDGERALEAMVKMQTTPANRDLGGGLAGNRDLEAYLKYGFVPAGKGRVSNTQEYAYDDWCVRQMALALRQDDVAEAFRKRADSWRNLFDSETGFARPRTAEGEWMTPFDPFRAPGFTEGNAWQYTWFVPHDPVGLVEVMGRERFLSVLEGGFRQSEPLRFNAPNERYGDYPVCHGNQPAMQLAYLFNWAGAPWLTQKWARSIQDRYYGFTEADAYLGDEDQGQMSGWFVMSAMGLFQLDGGARVEPIYEIGSPRFPKVTIHLDPEYHPGGTFTIEAKGASRRNIFVQGATLNGKRLDHWWFKASQLLGGGSLVLEMGPKPNRDWAAGMAKVAPMAR